MGYGDEWERELVERIHRWREARWWREWQERDMVPDDRLDEVGWDIFYCAVAGGMDEHDAGSVRRLTHSHVHMPVRTMGSLLLDAEYVVAIGRWAGHAGPRRQRGAHAQGDVP